MSSRASPRPARPAANLALRPGVLARHRPLFVGGFATFALLYSVQPLMPVFARDFAISPATASLSLSVTTPCWRSR